MINGIWKRFKDSADTEKQPVENDPDEKVEDAGNSDERPSEVPVETDKEPDITGRDETRAEENDPDDSGEETPEDGIKCPNCGVGIDGDSKFCNECGEQIKGVKEEAYEAGAPGGIEPWAVKFAEWFKKIPRIVKIGLPLMILLVAAGVVALFIIAGHNSPSANIDRYLSHLKVGEYKDAYGMLSHSEGQFSSFDYFKNWQLFQVDEMGRLIGYEIRERQHENSIFGKVISDDTVEGMSFVATLKYGKTNYDVRIDVESAGGTWPVNKYRLRLSRGPTRVLVSPVGSEIVIDGMKVGYAEESEVLSDALTLGDLPNDIESAIEYVRKIINLARSSVDEFKRIMVKIDDVANEAQWIFDRFTTSGFSWGSVADSADRIVQQSKDVGTEIAQLVMKIYWIFGGGDDGSVRADLTRAETGLDLNNLPEGLHGIEVSLPGCKTVKDTFYAPDGISVALKPAKETERKLAKAVNDYYVVYIDAVRNLRAESLKAVIDGKLLEAETQKVLDLLGKDQFQVLVLKSVKFSEYRMLSEEIATVRSKEKWAVNTYQGLELVSALAGVERDVTYTLEQDGNGVWKVIEKKVD
ncbi:MAG: zinc ribbon domain-containing protein [Actinobacteria bacterium]|nr:zinc ribbon domain-containing protein [Actinomycetota bacterium]